MTTWNYVGWAWIIWTLFNEGLAMMIQAKVYDSKNPIHGIVSWLLSGLAVWAALS